jgi:hypothetical protein
MNKNLEIVLKIDRALLIVAYGVIYPISFLMMTYLTFLLGTFGSTLFKVMSPVTAGLGIWFMVVVYQAWKVAREEDEKRRRYASIYRNGGRLTEQYFPDEVKEKGLRVKLKEEIEWATARKNGDRNVFFEAGVEVNAEWSDAITLIGQELAALGHERRESSRPLDFSNIEGKAFIEYEDEGVRRITIKISTPGEYVIERRDEAERELLETATEEEEVKLEFPIPLLSGNLWISNINNHRAIERIPLP